MFKIRVGAALLAASCLIGGGVLGSAAPPRQKSPAAVSGDVGELTAGLSAADAEKRAQSACALGEAGERAASAVPALIKLLDDGARIDPQQVCCRHPLDDQSGQPDHESLVENSVGEAAVQALIGIGKPSVEPLIAALADGRVRVRKNSAWALAQLRDRRALQPLLSAVKDESWEVRAYAAAALGEQRDAAVVEPLIVALKDESKYVRWFAAASLGQQRDRRVVEPLIAALKDAHPRVRAYAAAGLGQSRDGRAVEPLIAALRDENAQVRMYAAASLGQYRDRRAVGPLTLALKDEYRGVREYAQSALEQLGQGRPHTTATPASPRLSPVSPKRL